MRNVAITVAIVCLVLITAILTVRIRDLDIAVKTQKEYTELIRRELKFSLEQLRMSNEKSIRERGVLWDSADCPQVALDPPYSVITPKDCFTMVSQDLSTKRLDQAMGDLKKPILVGFQIGLHKGDSSCKDVLERLESLFSRLSLTIPKQPHQSCVYYDGAPGSIIVVRIAL